MNVFRHVLKQFTCKGMTRMSSIFVFNGKGSNKESQNLLLHALKDTVDLNITGVEFISAAEVKEGSWMSQTKLICFGGGYDLGFIESLGPGGMRNVREFVTGGGNYLGICAGAYFACDFIEFDKNGPLEVVGERSLKFYPGKCIGPAFQGFEYNSRKGVHAAPVTYQNFLTFDTYFEGGGYFLPYDLSSQTESIVLGRYEALRNNPEAIVKCRVGHGTAVLSCVHIEFSVHRLNHKDKYIRKLLPHFVRAEEKRKHVFRDVLTQLGVECANTQYIESTS